MGSAISSVQNNDAPTSSEPAGSPGLQSVSGLDQNIANGHQFMQTIEAVHRLSLSDSIIAGDYFSLSRKMDVSMKGMGALCRHNDMTLQGNRK